MEVLVLEIENPDCFWVAMKGCGPYVVPETEYKSLHAEMNLCYEMSQGTDEVKPVAIEEGQICVVFSEDLKCWCRAAIKSIIYCTDHYQTKCFLVDYAKYIFVKSKDIRLALEAFIQIPYRAKKCRLYGMKPMTLHISFYEDTAKMIPTNRWDSAAIECFQNLLKATEVEVQLCAVEDSTYHVFLYVTVKDEKVCVNDNLVINSFAAFKEAIEENTRSSADHQEDQTSLNADIFPVKIVNPALAFRPVVLQEKLSTNPDVDLTFLIETRQRLSTALDGNAALTVKATPGLPLKEDPAVHTDGLQQFLNSLPLKTHVIENCKQSSPNLSEERDFVFLSKPIEPVSVLETSPLFDDLRKELTRKKFVGPNFTESYCWPPVARGCDVVAISGQGSDPLVYIPPLLTCLQAESCYQALPKRDTPLALILCPGWKKAQLVFELLMTYGTCSRQLHPMLVILGQNTEDGSVEIQGCEVIVTTPYSLLRLFEHQGWLFCRLCHLVLDEVEVLFSDAAEQVFAILDCCKKAFGSEKQECSPQQIIAVGTRWHKHIAPLAEEFMNNPYVVITVVEEASIYSNVQQVVQPCMNSERTAVLLEILGCTPGGLQKVLVFTDSVDEAEMVHEALRSSSITSLKIHKESKFNFKYILEHWTKKYSSGTPTVLVLTDDCVQSLGITDATCVIHFSLPSPRILGQRLHSMSDNFCHVTKEASAAQEYTEARSVMLLTENSGCHVLEILQYLQRAGAEMPPELHSFTAKMLEAEEEKKLSRPLCAYLKTFGICKNRTTCPERHQINLWIDVAPNVLDEKITQLPGCVRILPLYVVHATNYFGRIVDKEKDQYTILAEEMKEYFEKPSNKVSAISVQKLGFYGLCEEAFFHRVQVVEISPKEEENLFFNVKIKYIDEGRTSQVPNYHLLHLPAKFQCLPPQAVEFVLCRVKPIDNELEWNPKVTHYVNQKIKGKLHEAKIVHTLGNTAWVDPMVRVTRIPALKITVNEYNVRAEILSTGLGADNPEHVTQLQKLCGHMKLLDHAEDLEPLGIKEGTSGPESASSPQNVLLQENSTENCSSSEKSVGRHPRDGVAQTKEAEETTLPWSKCFYPEMKWFQNEETVTVRVKIARAVDCKCEFSKEKVVFSARSGDKLYLADVELQQYILAERSTCVIKDEEVVIVLTKEKKEAWYKLLKNKNPHVSFDFEHWEEVEDESPFPVGRTELYCTATVPEELTDYSEDSGTEDDE